MCVCVFVYLRYILTLCVISLSKQKMILSWNLVMNHQINQIEKFGNLFRETISGKENKTKL